MVGRKSTHKQGNRQDSPYYLFSSNSVSITGDPMPCVGVLGKSCYGRCWGQSVGVVWGPATLLWMTHALLSTEIRSNIYSNTSTVLRAPSSSQWRWSQRELNVKLHHEPDGSISTSVYRKATHTDKYLDFSSHHPLPHKRAVISTLLNRAKTYSSWSDARNSEEDHISLALQWNGYPRKLICKHSPSSLTGASTPTAEPPEWKTTTVLPYVRGVSEPLRRILAPLKVRVCFKPCWTLRNLLSRPKAPIPDLQKSSVVYKIPCTHCSASYIGQTSRRLCQRLQEQQ